MIFFILFSLFHEYEVLYVFCCYFESIDGEQIKGQGPAGLLQSVFVCECVLFVLFLKCSIK